MKIAIRLPLLIVGCSLAAATAVGVSGYHLASQEIQAAAGTKLVAIRESRRASFFRYMGSIDEDLDLISSSPELHRALDSFTRAFGVLDDSGRQALQTSYNAENPAGPEDPNALTGNNRIASYAVTHRWFHPWFDLIRRTRAYHDVLIVNAKGDLVYSVAKESDFATNLLNGKWRGTGLGRVVRGGLSPQPTANQLFADFEPYVPSDGVPASFIAKPIKVRGETVGVLVFQMPIGKINEIMHVTAGMGRTGETYLVGSDYLMRTNSRFSKESTILKQKVSTGSVLDGIAGKDGLAIIDNYRGVPVLSAFHPISFKGIQWVILSELDMDEVAEPVVAMRRTMTLLALFTASVIALIGLAMTLGLTRPLTRLSKAFQGFGATRQLNQVPHLDRRDEIGDMARTFNDVSMDIETYISERTKAEAELARQKAIVETTMENMDQGIAMFDEDLNMVTYNQRVVDMYALPKHLYGAGRRLEDIFRYIAEKGEYGPGDVEEQVQSRLELVRKVEPHQFERTLDDGRFIEVRGNPVKTSGFVMTHTDITERKHAEEELARKEAQLSLALDTITDGIWVIDADMRFSMFNDRYRELMGLSKEVLHTGAALADVTLHLAESGAWGPGDPKELSAIRVAAIANDQEIISETEIADGRILETRKAPRADGGAAGMVTDITERKLAERRLKDAYDIITGSIQYATRIQRSVLPPDEYLAEDTADHFIIWEPRDMVGGDIYWYRRTTDGFLVILTDCTGHGVPGAFMSLIATGAVDRALRETPDGNPARLIHDINRSVKRTLGQDRDDGDSDDGLELGICLVEPRNNQISFAEARFSLFHANATGINEIKGDKTGVGYRRVPIDQTFTNHAVKIHADSAFYMTSDGLTDQVGGSRGRMFGKKRFVTLLAELQGKPMSEQKTAIYDALIAYQGDQVRRDDVSVVGFAV